MGEYSAEVEVTITYNMTFEADSQEEAVALLHERYPAPPGFSRVDNGYGTNYRCLHDDQPFTVADWSVFTVEQIVEMLDAGPVNATRHLSNDLLQQVAAYRPEIRDICRGSGWTYSAARHASQTPERQRSYRILTALRHGVCITEAHDWYSRFSDIVNRILPGGIRTGHVDTRRWSRYGSPSYGEANLAQLLGACADLHILGKCRADPDWRKEIMHLRHYTEALASNRNKDLADLLWRELHYFKVRSIPIYSLRWNHRKHPLSLETIR